MRKSTKEWMSIGGLFLATLFWGASFFSVKSATLEAGVWPFIFWRFTCATFFFVLAYPKGLFKCPLVTMRNGTFMGFFLFLAIWTQTEGLQLTTASRAGFITSLYVPFTSLFAWILLGRRGTWKEILVVFVAVAGLYVLTSEKEAPFSAWLRQANRGDLWVLGTAVVSALHILLVEKFSRDKRNDSLSLGLWQVLACTCFVMAAVLSHKLYSGVSFAGKWQIMTWSRQAIGSALFNAVFTTVFGFVMQIICQKTVGALKASLIFALEAPFASLFAFGFAGEVMSLREICGATLVFMASIVPEKWLRRGSI